MRTNQPALRRFRQHYLLIAISCTLFVLLTFIAMLTYSGGSYDNHGAAGYSFSHNFFSDLGRLTAHSGRPNWFSAVLFFLALSSAGACLVVFFIYFPRILTRNNLQHWLSLVGSTIGVLAGFCFIGIAFAPADVALAAHGQFVIWAFRLFPLAVLLYVPAMFMDYNYPRRYASVFAVFCLMLIGYYLLLTNGPSYASSQGQVIQVIGQKVIVYASILSIGIESLGVYKFLDGSK